MKKNYIHPESNGVEVFPESPLLVGSTFGTNAASSDVDEARRSIQKQSIWNKHE